MCFYFTSNLRSLSRLCRSLRRSYQAVQQFCAVSECDRHFKGFGFKREPVLKVHAGNTFCCKATLMEQQGREEEELYLGQIFSNASALPHREDQHVGG